MNQLNPNLVLQEIVAAAREWVQVSQTEKTKRAQITAWERTSIKDIRARRDILMTYLERSFDERKENFNRLFDALETALENDRQDVSGILQTITTLAGQGPFADLQDADALAALFKSGDLNLTV